LDITPWFELDLPVSKGYFIWILLSMILVDFLVIKLIATIIKMHVVCFWGIGLILITAFDVPSQLECDDCSDSKEKCRSMGYGWKKKKRRKESCVLDARKGNS
jgi:hypothetical protein